MGCGVLIPFRNLRKIKDPTSHISCVFYPGETPDYSRFSKADVPFAIPHKTKAKGRFNGEEIRRFRQYGCSGFSPAQPLSLPLKLPFGFAL